MRLIGAAHPLDPVEVRTLQAAKLHIGDKDLVGLVAVKANVETGERLHRFGRVGILRRHRVGAPGAEQIAQMVFHQLDQKVLLGGEVIVESRGADPDLPRDIAHGDGGIAVKGE